MIRIASLAVDYNDLHLLEFFLKNTADLMFEIKNLDMAVFFYNQLVLYISQNSVFFIVIHKIMEGNV